MSVFWGRKIANVPRDVLTDIRRTCRRCKQPKFIKGGSLANHKFVCAACVKPVLASLLLSGCAALQPQSVNLALDHTSHISQHLGPDQRNYGIDVLALNARWAVDRLSLEVSEGICFQNEYTIDGESLCGALYGPREVFNARLSYSVWQKHE